MTWSTDFKDAMIKIYNLGTYTLRQISLFFNVSKSALHRWINNINIQKIENKKSRINNDILTFLKRSLDHNPFQILDYLVIKIFKKFDIMLTKKTVSNYIKIIGYSKKKIVSRIYNTKNIKEHLKNRNDIKQKIKKIKKEDIICIDESGIHGDIYANYGYCSTKQRLVYNIPYKSTSYRYSLLMAITVNGVEKYELYKNAAVNTDIYYAFIKKLIKNKKNKYLLMDNVAFHKSIKIKKLVERSGNHIIYIPPYSPDFNPIEEVFSKLKSYIKSKINPVKLNKNIEIIIKQFVKNNKDFKMYYTHAFD